MPMTYGGAQVQKSGALWKPWGASIVVLLITALRDQGYSKGHGINYGKYGKVRLLARRASFLLMFSM